MKAAYLEATGAPEVIKVGDLPTPTPKGGEVLVKVASASLNPIDTYIRSGMVAMALPKPFITGTDFAGTVAAVGSGVTAFKVGDRVWGSNQGLLGRQGSCAEYLATGAEWCYPTPAGIADQDAAAVALVGITAHIGLFERGRLKAGETAFVNGGTGGVGSMVVQMAKAIGAKVITTVGSAEKAELCRQWGADLVLNYKTDDIPTRVKAFGLVHVWYETQREPNFFQTVDLLAPRGRMIIMAGRQAQPQFPVGPFYVKGCELHGFAMFNSSPAEQRACAEDIQRWLAEKKLRPHIGKVFPIEETAAAHRFLEENTLQKTGTLAGKVIVSVA